MRQAESKLSFTLHCISKRQCVPLQFSLCQPARQETMHGFVGRKEKRISMKIIYVYLVYTLNLLIRTRDVVFRLLRKNLSLKGKVCKLHNAKSVIM